MTTTKGLSGVVAADTALSHVDGQRGELIYRGYDISDLGRQATFEEVVYLLWYGDLPSAGQLHELQASLAEQRALPDAALKIMATLPTYAHPMAALRTVVSLLGALDPEADSLDPESVRAKAVRLTAQFATIVAAWERIRNKQHVIEPRADLGHAANFLYMLSGKVPDVDAVNALNAYLVLLADHGFNASTFAARVTTGTLADVYSAVTSAVGTLKGASHGGANQKAMEQFLAAAEYGDASEWYRQVRQAGQRIMGIGHRVYKVEDPRAKILRPLAERLATSSGERRWYDLAAEIETLARSDAYFIERDLHANVDYYSAVVLYTLGLPVDQFTCLFAVSRIAGWTAHILEQIADNRLIRPGANYVGPLDREFVPLLAR